MSNQVDDPGLETWATFLRAQTAVLRQLEAEMAAECGLPLVWYEVLLHLGGAPRNRLRMQELSDLILLTQSGCSRLVGRMEGEGLVERCQDDADRRGRIISLTSKGRRVLRRAAVTHRRGIDEHLLQHITEKEQVLLRRALAKVPTETHRTRATTSISSPPSLGATP